MEIEFEACIDPLKKVIAMDGEGSATIKLTTSADQIAEVLKIVPYCKEKKIKVTFEIE